MKLTVLCLAAALTLLPVAALAMPSCSVTFSQDDLSFSKSVHDDDTFDVVGLKGAGQLLEPPTIVRRDARLRCQSAGTIFDASGRRAAVLRPGCSSLDGLAPGIYFLREQPDRSPRRIVVVR